MERAVSFQRRPAPTEHPLPHACPDSIPPKAERGRFHGAVVEFKRTLIESTLRQAEGNRSRAARSLGLQRTYLLRLMRDLRVNAPPPRRNGGALLGPAGAGQRRAPKTD